MAAEAFLDAPLGEDVVAGGFCRSPVSPGRLEVMSSEPLVVLDGAHNQDAARALVATVSTFFPGRPADSGGGRAGAPPAGRLF
ncbi:MAG: hypothetical protein Ct9H300mP31_16670 [Acidimicrobiaceae bacterium]|nr:MAG: hypothetical protein Ct9H300mP31_16670 [Acidimicrobiaceae bacterium]